MGWLKSPIRNASLAFIASLPLWLYKLYEQSQNEPLDKSVLDKWYFYIPAFAFFGAIAATEFWRVFVDQRTRIRDFKTVRNLEERVNAESPPKIYFNGTQTIDVSVISLISDFFNAKSPDEWADLAVESKDPGLAFVASRKYLASTPPKYDKGFDFLRNGFDLLNGKRPKLSWKRWLASFNLSFAAWAARKCEPRNLAGYMFSAAYDALSNPERAWSRSALGRLVADEFKDTYRKEMYVFHALLASAQRRSDAKQTWRDAFHVIRNSPDTLWERIGESRSLVRRVKNNEHFSGTFLFKEHNLKDSLETEVEKYEELKKKGFDTPEILFQEPEEKAMMMRVLGGETLYDLLLAKKEVPMMIVVDTLASIHSKMPNYLDKLSVAWKLRSKLLAKEFGISRDRARRIIQNYRPVYDAVVKDAVWVWNKDAHPENWIIDKGKIYVIDCEADYCVPAAFDLANLLEYGDFFDKRQINSYLTRYIQMAQIEKLPIDETTFRRSYYNAVIHRMLSLSSAWSSPERPKMHGLRKNALLRAMNAIDALKTEDRNYYILHKDSYDALQSELADIAAGI